ncbi:cytochrome family 51 (sterol 14-demethylase) [Neofusicoccum parvum]|uniref:Cytochrome family 51 (Sterol 14-demethylase) n=1 Tax=Neofusicoccum parvum TaxID=310453 RepID=A0ACB5S0T8_9PEZI|nr:cytochrome family 51 (sterol 14-demethylase) [Neofusicoccum parvum]GME48252.1 cytochrome family 51 (sterol 14-demethylase) [Neofusicoccum parvum]
MDATGTAAFQLPVYPGLCTVKRSIINLDAMAAAAALHLVAYVGAALLATIALHVLRQLFFYKKNEPPVVFHWFPFIGSTVTYGMDPLSFFISCKEKYGEVFTFILLGQKTTVYLGVDGNEFILNGKLKDVNAEEVYGPITTPVFGSDVVYDCPNSKLMEQKKFVKFGLTQEALESYVPLIEEEVLQYMKTSRRFKGPSGTIDIPAAMAEVTIFTASRALQGEEVRAKLTADFADLYHDLDLGFSPLNALMPWLPIPSNWKRDAAREKMREVYMEIIKDRRASEKDTHDMITNLMRSTYKNGTPVPDKEIAHMMITLLMAGQHSSSSASSWIMLRLASQPKIVEELFEEQVRAFGKDLPPLQYKDLEKLPLHQNVIKETLRVHSSIHSIMRKVKNPLHIPGTQVIVPDTHVVLASPVMTAMSEQYFSDPKNWNPHRWDDRKDDEESEDMIDYGYGAVSKGTKSPYLPFGAGRHRCIGEKFAYLNLGVIVATLVRNFKFSNPKDREGVPATDYASLFSRPMQPAMVCWERRFPEN